MTDTRTQDTEHALQKGIQTYKYAHSARTKDNKMGKHIAKEPNTICKKSAAKGASRK
jgi:hypothetical protein